MSQDFLLKNATPVTQVTPVTHEFGLSIIINTQNSSGFHFITSTKTSMEFKKN